MKCPTGKIPWRECPQPMPMLVPECALEAMRARWPQIWIEPIEPLPMNGQVITYAQWTGALKEQENGESRNNP